MFSHVMIGSNDLAHAKTFYDALFTAIGDKPGRYDAKGRLVYVRGGTALMVTTPIDGQPAHHANGSTIGFALDGPAEVDAWHKAGTKEAASSGRRLLRATSIALYSAAST